MKCNQSRPGFEIVSPCPFPTTITITPRLSVIILVRVPRPSVIILVWVSWLLSWTTYTIMNSSSFIITNPILFSLRLPPSRVEHMHYSLGGAGLGHISVGRVVRYADLVGCVLVPVAVSRGALWTASSSIMGSSWGEWLGLLLGAWGTSFSGNTESIFGAAGPT